MTPPPLKKVLLLILAFPFIVLFLPIVIIVKAIIDVVKAAKEKGILNLSSLIFAVEMLIALGFVLPLWIGGYYVGGTILARSYGFVEQQISIAGTGSMYPTFPKGTGKTSKEQAKEIVSQPGMMLYPNGIPFWGKRYFNYTIGRGDIVEFENKTTHNITLRDDGEEAGFVKRVIALAGDTIQIRDGVVILNGKPLSEPYIARARSTFGGDFLAECKTMTIPSGKIFVMGDNRKGSLDSRYELGLVSYNDIHFVIPLAKQRGILDQHWRDTSNDLSDSAKIKLDQKRYLELLNAKRNEAKVQMLKYQPKLEVSASKRAGVILKYDDFSFEATRSGLTMEKAMEQAGYSNIVWGEAPIQGYYDADELIENQFEFSKSKKFLLNQDYQDIGVAEVEGQINGCPTEVIVQHLAGYVPPNYKKETVDSWKQTLAKLKEIQPGWASLKTFIDFYSGHKQDVDRINDIISTRISNIGAVVKRMEANQWLSKDEVNYTYQDEKLGKEQETLANKLNK